MYLKKLYTIIYKELSKINNKINKTIWPNASLKKTYRFPSKSIKRCSTSLVVREMPIKITTYYFKLVTYNVWLKTDYSKSVTKKVEQFKLPHVVIRHVRWCDHFGKQFVILKNVKYIPIGGASNSTLRYLLEENADWLSSRLTNQPLPVSSLFCIFLPLSLHRIQGSLGLALVSALA